MIRAIGLRNVSRNSSRWRRVTLSAARFLEQLEESVQGGLPLVIVTRGLGVMIVAALIAVALFSLPSRVEIEEGAAVATPEGRDWMSAARFFGALIVLVLVGACAAGYVTFANFVILQIGWTAAVLAILYVVVTLSRGGIEAALAPTSILGRKMISGLGVRREQLAPLAVLLSGIVTLLCFLAAALVALAPLGYEFGRFPGQYSLGVRFLQDRRRHHFPLGNRDGHCCCSPRLWRRRTDFSAGSTRAICR